MRKLFLLLAIFICTISAALAQATTVYIVRHAEKDMSDPNTKDPRLTGVGLQRAQDLSTTLEKEEIAAIFSTSYIRNLQTAEPTAKRTGKKVIVYDPTNMTDLVTTVKNQYNGKTVLIVGHSNTVLPLVRAFGGNTIVGEIKDTEYRYLFKVVISGEKTTTTELYYGD
jgi:2,3-bisphosphoglycerate-dependent phosphoglycerate mutase